MRLFVAFALVLAASATGPCLAQDAPAAAAAAVPLDPESLALANQIMDLSYPPEGRRAMLMRAADTMVAQARTAATGTTGSNADPQVERILQRYLARARVLTERAIADHSTSLFAAFARAYARQFTREELVQIRAFVSTPAGARYVQRSGDLLSDPDVAEANTAYMASVFIPLQALQADLRREMLERLSRPQAQPSPTS